MIYFLKKLFKIKSYRFIGRGGMLYFNDRIEYYVDTQNYVPNNQSKDNYGVAIFSNGIRYNKMNGNINEAEKSKVALEAQALLAKDGIVATID